MKGDGALSALTLAFALSNHYESFGLFVLFLATHEIEKKKHIERPGRRYVLGYPRVSSCVLTCPPVSFLVVLC